MEKKSNLDEVSLIRPVLILLLVLYHSFAPWCGGWEPFDGMVENPTYWWIGKAAYSFMLPMFVFVSGYIWAYQREFLGKKQGLIILAKKKFKRLYIPSIIFSLIYVGIFNFTLNGRGNSETIIDAIFNGAGHMWFLPMLFWCFIITWCLLLLKQRNLIIAIGFVMYLIPNVNLPFRISVTFEYIIFFLLGYYTLPFRDFSQNKVYRRVIAIEWLIFISVFVIGTIFIEYLNTIKGEAGIIERFINLEARKLLTFIYAFSGIYALYLTAVYITQGSVISRSLISIGSLCMGVYLFQQFILKYLYYYTTLHTLIEPKCFPFFSCAFTLLLSLVFTYMLRKTKLGKYLV